MPILSSKMGDNSDLFPDILSLYAKESDIILDMTYGLGVFWKKVNLDENYMLYANDLDKERGDFHDDFRHTHWENNFFNIVVLDPPYAGRSGSKVKASIDRNYNIAQKALEQGIVGSKQTMQFYFDGMKEAYRLLKQDGYLFLKCMDEVESGKQQRNHITLFNKAIEMGFVDEDLFVLVQKGIPTMRHSYQKHARKNNSFMWILRKK